MRARAASHFRVPLGRIAVVAAVAAMGLSFGDRPADAAPQIRAVENVTKTPRLSVKSQRFFLNGAVDLRLRLRLKASDEILDSIDRTNGTRLAADGSIAASGPRVILYSYPAVTDPADLTTRPSTKPIGSVEWPLNEVATRNDGSLDLNLVVSPGTKTNGRGISMQPLHIETLGLYPIEVRIVDQTTIARSYTFINRIARDNPPADQFAASIVVGIRDIGPAPNKAERTDAREDLNRLIELAERTDLPLTVILPPSVIEKLLNRDDALDRKVGRALAGQTLLSAPAFALEPDAALGASITDRFEETWSVGTEQLRSRYPNTTIDTSTMVIDAPTSADGVGLLRDVGMRFAIVPNSVYRSADGQIGDYTDPGLLFAIRSSDAQTVPAAVGSPALSLLDPEVRDSETVANTTATERAVDLLANLTAQQSSKTTRGRSAFLMTPEIGVPDSSVIAAIDALTTAEVGARTQAQDQDGDDPDAPARWMVFGPASEIAQRTESHRVNGETVTLGWPISPTSVIASRLEHIDAAETVIRQSVSMLPEDDTRRESWVWRVRSAVSTRLTDTQAGTLIESSLAQAERLRSAVPAPEPFEFTLTGSNTTLRFQLTNTAGTPLDVVFVVRSDRLIVPLETPVHLEPSTVTDIPIEVSARSNGSAAVRVQVVTPDGLALFAPIEMNGRATSFGGTGQLLTVGALLVLMSWWLSFLRRRGQESTPASDAATGLRADDPDQRDRPRPEQTRQG